LNASPAAAIAVRHGTLKRLGLLVYVNVMHELRERTERSILRTQPRIWHELPISAFIRDRVRRNVGDRGHGVAAALTGALTYPLGRLLAR
jgi:hypothetical protein